MIKKHSYIKKKEKFINSKNLSKNVISLPLHPWLKEKDIIKISNIVNKFERYA